MVKQVVIYLFLICMIGCTVNPRINNPEVGNKVGDYSFEIEEIKNLEVFFSEPSEVNNGDYNHGPEVELVKAIRSAKISIEMAIYSLNLWNIRDAILDAFNNGVKIRIVMESENLEDEVPQQLMIAGIEILGDRRESLMHNKFAIIDRQDVWTGSMNFTVGSTYYDHNNLVHINSQEIAQDFLTEFNEMFELDMFGNNIIPSTPFPQARIGDALVEVYFSPDDKVSEHIIEAISQAQESIVFMAYSFTSDNIGDAIRIAFKDGISVIGIMDKGQAIGNQGSEYDQFINLGIQVYLDESSGLMHHKVIIIDHKIVITGSYNFSLSAELRNDENVIIIHDAEIANQYMDEFNKLIVNTGRN